MEDFFRISDPLPMKLRALPQSFWLQPNRNPNFPPSCSTLPPLIIGKEVFDGKNKTSFRSSLLRNFLSSDDHRSITPLSSSSSSPPPVSRSERFIKVGNPELLFQLFDSVEKDHKKKPSVVRKGRFEDSNETRILSKFLISDLRSLLRCWFVARSNGTMTRA